jgi:hypothetical protein
MLPDLERQRLTHLFSELLYQYERKHSLTAINVEYDQRNGHNPWVRLAMESDLNSEVTSEFAPLVSRR